METKYRFIDFQRHFEPFKIFSIQNIMMWNPDFDSRRLVEWQKKGYLKRIINRWYCFGDIHISEPILYLVANRIYAPSYVSFQSALAHYRLIPEGVYTVTSATSIKTQSYNTFMGAFSYRHIKPELLFGYKLIEVGVHEIKMAEPEKAILDFFYLNTGLQSVHDMESLRINYEELNLHFNIGRLYSYLDLYKSKALNNRIATFIKTYTHA